MTAYAKQWQPVGVRVAQNFMTPVVSAQNTLSHQTNNLIRQLKMAELRKKVVF